jgi:hypothetical protein
LSNCDILRALVRNGSIKDFLLEDFNDETEREVERLTIELNDGNKIVVQSFCSGASEGSCLFIIGEE